MAAFTGRHLDLTQASTLLVMNNLQENGLWTGIWKYGSTFGRKKSFDSYLTEKAVNGLDFRTWIGFLWHGMDLKLPVKGTLNGETKNKNGFAPMKKIRRAEEHQKK